MYYVASDKGYSSMSQEDIHRDIAVKQSASSSVKSTISLAAHTPRSTTNDAHHTENEAFRAKVGSIIKRSVNNLHEADGHNIAGCYRKFYCVSCTSLAVIVSFTVSHVHSWLLS